MIDKTVKLDEALELLKEYYRVDRCKCSIRGMNACLACETRIFLKRICGEEPEQDYLKHNCCNYCGY